MVLYSVRKLDLSQYAFSLNFYCPIFPSQSLSILSLLNLLSITQSFICHLLEALKTKDSKKKILSNTGKGLNIILQPKKSLKSLRPTI